MLDSNSKFFFQFTIVMQLINKTCNTNISATNARQGRLDDGMTGVHCFQRDIKKENHLKPATLLRREGLVGLKSK